MPPPPLWLRRRSSKKQRSLVLWALRAGAVMTAQEIAVEARRPWKCVCRALDDLMVRGQVELVAGKYRRMETGGGEPSE